MAYLEEISKFKYDFLRKLTENPKIVKLLNVSLSDPDCPDELWNKNIFPFLFIPDANEKTSTYICYELYVPTVFDDLYENLELHIYVFTHQSTSYVDGYSRVDLLQTELDKMLNGSTLIGDGYGLDTIHLKGSIGLNINSQYRGKEMIYQVMGFNQCGRCRT